MDEQTQRLFKIIKTLCKNESGYWELREESDRGRYVLTWWPDGWMRGRAYYTPIITDLFIPKMQQADYFSEVAKTAIMSVKDLTIS